MHIVFVWFDQLWIHRSRADWQVVHFDSIDGLIDALGGAFPKGSRVGIVYEGADVTIDHADVPNAGLGLVRSALRESSTQYANSSVAWSFDIPPRTKGLSRRISVYSETSIHFRAVREVLKVRNRVLLEAVWPWSALGRTGAGDGDRAQLAVTVDARRAMISGTGAEGEPVDARVTGSNEEIAAWLVAQAKEAGAPISDASSMPGTVEWHVLNDTEAGPAYQNASKIVSKFNRLELVGFDILANRARRFGRKHPSNLLNQVGSDVDLNSILKPIAWAALITLIGMQGYWVRLHRQSSEEDVRLAREKRELIGASDRIQVLRAELRNLRTLYGSDAGWGLTPPRNLLTALGSLTPTPASLDALTWSSTGELGVSGVVWGIMEMGESDLWLETFVQTLSKELPAVRIPLERAKINRKNGQFTFSGKSEDDA